MFSKPVSNVAAYGRQPLLRSARSLAALLAGVGLLALAACSDSGEAATEVAQIASGTSATMPASGGAPAGSNVAAPAARMTDPASAEAPAPEGSVDVAALMQPGTLPDIVIGDANAPVTIVEYASMTCAHCADFHENSYPGIKADYIDTGKAKLIIREFPFDPRAVAAFMLARCAGDGRRTSMVDVLFQQQENWAHAENGSAALLQIARLAGMSQDEFVACLQNKDLQGKVVAVQQRGQSEFGVNATPTFFINGDRYAGALSDDAMAAVIESHL